MNIVDDMFSFLKKEEMEVECIVRNINMLGENAANRLRSLLNSELTDSKKRPVHTHVTLGEAPAELSECSNVAEYLSKTSKLMTGQTTEIDEVRPLLVKAKHWGERAIRVKNSYGELEGIINIITKLRRHTNFLESIIQFQITLKTQGNLATPTKMLNVSQTSLSGGAGSLEMNNSDDRSQKEALSALPIGSGITNNITPVDDLFRSFTQIGSTSGISTGAMRKQSNVGFNPTPPKTNFGNPNFGSNFSPVQNIAPNIQMGNDVRLNDFRYVPRWNIFFEGTEGLEVNDFIYKIEETARREYFPFDQLVRVLPHFMKGKASEWLWTYMRTHPGATWNDIRASMISRFCCYETEMETRNMIQRCIQNVDESINDFVLKIESYNSKLTNNRYSDAELVEILRNNMKSSLQNATLLLNFETVEQLRIACAKYERLWFRTRQHNRSVNPPTYQRPRPNINEIYFPEDESYSDKSIGDYNQYPIHEFDRLQINEIRPEIHEALSVNVSEIKASQPSSTQNPNFICWNCRDLGHTYWGCLQPLSEFCYGCGKADVRLPQCPKCKDNWHKRNSGNARPNGVNPGQNRSVPAIKVSGRKATEDAACNTEPHNRYR